MSYDIEVRQSRFPNALDPTLTGFFPKYHGWEAFWAPVDYMEADEDAYIAIRRNEIIILAKSGIIVHVTGKGRNGHHDDYQGYLGFQATKYTKNVEKEFDGVMKMPSHEDFPAEMFGNVLECKDDFCREFVMHKIMALRGGASKKRRYAHYLDVVSRHIGLLEKYNLPHPDPDREAILKAHARCLQTMLALPDDTKTTVLKAACNATCSTVMGAAIGDVTNLLTK